MKRIIAVIMAAMLMLAFTACGTKGGDEGTTTIASPIEILNTVWDSYAEDEKFPAAGGDMTEANMNMEGPGVYGLEDAEGFTATFNFPADSMSKIDSAATLMHMMNANTFSAAAVHVANASDLEALKTEIKDSVMNTQWMCGFPEKLVIVTVEDYIVYGFGNADLISTFTSKLTTAYTNANIAVDEAIVA